VLRADAKPATRMVMAPAQKNVGLEGPGEALRRPGRFDRELVIGVPDQDGRREVLGIHTRGMPLADDVDLDGLAERTERYTGVDVGDPVRRAAS